MLAQTVISWFGGSQEVSGHQTAAAVITLLLVLSLGMVVRVSWAGVVFDVSAANPTKEEGAKLETTGKPAV
jgi:hypothetical protein